MSMFGGSWKHENNPACTRSVSLQYVQAGQDVDKHEDETLKEEDEITPIVLLSNTLLTLASHLNIL